MRNPEMFRKLWVMLMAGVMLSACSGVPVQLGSTTDEKYDLTRPRELSVNACGFQLLLLIPINTNNRAERAYRALKRQAGGDYIADIKITEEWTYAFVGTLYCTTIEATAYPKVKT